MTLSEGAASSTGNGQLVNTRKEGGHGALTVTVRRESGACVWHDLKRVCLGYCSPTAVVSTWVEKVDVEVAGTLGGQSLLPQVGHLGRHVGA